jgi:hypothetical protein
VELGLPQNLAVYDMKKVINGRKASSEMLMIPSANADLDSHGRRAVGRRSFLKGLGMAGAALLPASALSMSMSEGTPQGADLMHKGGRNIGYIGLGTAGASSRK